jgi:3-oxoacyl-[acyl-carrier protein] reductase
MNEFANKTALVTGASRGIGAATARALARAGVARVVVQYNSFAEGAAAVVDSIHALGAAAQAIHADLSRVEGIHGFVEELGRVAPEVDILINNAGSLIQRSTLPDYPEWLYDAIMNLNVKSLWFITKACVPHMIAARSGVIVNISSIAARNGGGPGATIYAAAKAAVSGITKGLAKELAPQGIRVNALSPGTVDNHFQEMFTSREVLDSVVRATPCGRLGTNEDMAAAIVFLCSRGADYIHGQTIEVNGGHFMI